MSIPAPLTAALTAFQATVTAARPISSLTPYQLSMLVTQGQGVLDLIDASLAATNAALDAPDPTGNPLAMIANIRARRQACADAAVLSDMRGFMGRALLNLSQGVA